MGSFIHYDRIAEKLEIARTMGLVKSYSVLPADQARRSEASVTVWRAAGASESAIKDYLVGLLHGLVAVEQILVISPSQTGETAVAVGSADPLHTSVPVAA